MDMAASTPVFIVLTDAQGGTVACRYLRSEALFDWLGLNGGGKSVRCDIYDAAPSLGGHLTKTLWRGNLRKWSEAAA